MANYPVTQNLYAVPVRMRNTVETALDMFMLTHSTGDETFSLELADPLPEVCPRHGRPAVSRKSEVIQFWRTPRGIEQVTAGLFFRMLLRRILATLALRAFRLPTTVATLHGTWPVCGRCVTRSAVLRWVAYLFGFAGIAMIIAFFVANQLGVSRIPVGFVVAFFPGWLPCGLLVAYAAYQASRDLVHFDTLTDRENPMLRVPPDFPGYSTVR
ncbi:hypothetical protein NLM24_10175 [Nocardia zapadnayensis]|uniref:hypothetical protein n=1 Tax=Nocardia rhamnosiphila TaxID=426716 RepID=UPI002246A501|nr:hypothetical protein [Nocardia zapadnayensis]MCX0271065.1 hypothetical protein [Nocardia zapadnayensis]